MYEISQGPSPSSMDVCDLGGGSVPPRLHTGGAKNPLGQEEPAPHKGRATEDCNIQCKNITKR